jgi:photosystem II stability/assembly factor-like uncharacterized protein
VSGSGAAQTVTAQVLHSSNGGKSWTGQLSPSGYGYLSGVACPSARDCWAVGSEAGRSVALSTSDGGRSWADQTVPSGFFGEAITCASASDCWAAGDSGSSANSFAVIATSDGGRAWHLQRTPSGMTGSPSAIACLGSKDCWVVGATFSSPTMGFGWVLHTANGGRSWTREALPKGIEDLHGVACPSARDCVATGGASGGRGVVILTTGNGGKSWREQKPPRGMQLLYGVSCVKRTGDCWAVGGTASATGRGVTGYYIATRNGGRSWVVQARFKGHEAEGVSCPTVKRCAAVGSGEGEPGFAAYTTNGG